MGLGLDQPSHWAVIAIAALVLFGYKKLPEMARSAGKSMRIFKTELKGMADDDDMREKSAQASTLPAEVAPPPPAPAQTPSVAETTPDPAGDSATPRTN